MLNIKVNFAIRINMIILIPNSDNTLPGEVKCFIVMQGLNKLVTNNLLAIIYGQSVFFIYANPKAWVYIASRCLSKIT
jgi:hypothetical protein